MKSIVLASALVAVGLLVGTVGGRPHVLKRAIVTEVVYVTETVADVVVYVDEDGAPYLTTTIARTTFSTSSAAVTSVAVSTSTSEIVSTSAPPAPPSSSDLPLSTIVTPVAEPTSVVMKQTTPEPVTSSSVIASPYVPPSTTQEAPPAPPTSNDAPPKTSAAAPTPDVPTKEGNSGSPLSLGVTYDPFTGSQDSSRCKTDQEITTEFAKMKGYKTVRIYGMGCNIVPLAIQNAVKNGQKLMAGVYTSSTGNGEDLSTVINVYKDAVRQYANGDWDIIQLFSVENERVNDHDLTASAVVDAIQRARGQLRGLGYNGPVGAVETVPAMLDNPAICKASDVVMVNCHAFFDTNTKAQDAGTFVKNQVQRVKSACNTDRVVVTESGWPHQGNANGAAVPSPDNQRMALESLRSNFDHDLFLFNAFDSPWKADWASSFNAERFWGVIQ